MKVFIAFNLFLACIIGFGFLYTKYHKGMEYDFMNQTHTDMIKGVAILSVMWAHCGAGLGVPMLQFIAGIGVSLFLVCSGYGLMCSYQKNGLQYFWRKRFFKILIPCWLVYLIEALVMQKYDWQEMLLRTFLLQDANWYIPYILLSYVLFWCICKVTKDKEQMRLTLIISAFAIWFILDSFFWADAMMPFLKARQMMSFPIGVMLAMNREKLVQRLEVLQETKKWQVTVWALVLLVIGCMGQVLAQTTIVEQTWYIVSNAWYLVVNLLLTAGCFFMLMQCRSVLCNATVVKLGQLSFEFFLLHFYVIYRVKKVSDIFLYAIVLVIAVWLLNKVSDFLMKIGMRKSR